MVLDEADEVAQASVNVDGAQRMHNAYMLIYEKAEKKPMKIVCPEKAVRLIKEQPKELIDFIRQNPMVL